MVQICNYSSLIFAGNVTVLLIVSMSTDYWEYRQFNSTMLNQSLSKTNYIEIVRPSDTNSYVELWYRRKFVHKRSDVYQIELFYQPPILAKNYFLNNYIQNNGNVTPDAVTVFLFRQYGNLFRDCNALEGPVSDRLHINEFSENRCTYLSGRSLYSSDGRYSMAVIHLERAACAFALLCMVSMVTGLMFGGYGLLAHQTRVLVWASCCSLASDTKHHYILDSNDILQLNFIVFSCVCTISKKITTMEVALKLLAILIGNQDKKSTFIIYLIDHAYSQVAVCIVSTGILLTLSIALFHGKCHIMRETELKAGKFTPLRKLINESRVYIFGWSFVVAWMCVFLCFISSFVWLYKAQDPKHSRIPGEHYVRHRTFNKKKYFAYLEESDQEQYD